MTGRVFNSAAGCGVRQDNRERGTHDMNRDRIGRHEARPVVQNDREENKRRMVERATAYAGKHRGAL